MGTILAADVSVHVVSAALNHALIRGIAAERTRQKITQTDLGRRIGWSARTVMAIEGGDRAVLAHELIDICRALGVSLDRLLIDAAPADREGLGFGA